MTRDDIAHWVQRQEDELLDYYPVDEGNDRDPAVGSPYLDRAAVPGLELGTEPFTLSMWVSAEGADRAPDGEGLPIGHGPDPVSLLADLVGWYPMDEDAT